MAMHEMWKTFELQGLDDAKSQGCFPDLSNKKSSFPAAGTSLYCVQSPSKKATTPKALKG